MSDIQTNRWQYMVLEYDEGGFQSSLDLLLLLWHY